MRVRLLYGAGVLARLQLDLTAAQRFAEEQQRLARSLGDRQGIADSCGVMGWVEEFLGNYQKALNCFNKRLTLSRALDNRRGVAYALRGLGETATALGMYDEADAWLNEALTIFLQLGDQRYVAQLWNDLGQLARHANRLAVAEPFFQLSLTAHRRLNDKHGIATALLNLSRLALMRQDGEGAAYHREAAQSLREMADKLLHAALWSNQARLAVWAGNGDEADIAILQALRLRRELNHRPGVVEDLEQCAETAFAKHQAVRALCLWAAADHFRSTMQMPLPRSEQSLYAQRLELARVHLDQAEALAAWQAGQVMSWEQAILYALGE